jgi:cytochrome c peroxidase
MVVRKTAVAALVASFVVLFIGACGGPGFRVVSGDFWTAYGIPEGKTVIEPLKKPDFLDPEKVALGDKLYHDKRLSKDETLACASCHGLSTGGVDGKARSIGIGGAEGGINAPTVLNSAFNIHQFWDGRAKDLQAQAAGPVANPKEMGAEWPIVVDRLREDAEYTKTFAKFYPQGITKETVTDAIAYFEQSLITCDSKVDKYLNGDTSALTDLEKRGFRLFQDFGCSSCHQGSNVGGNLFAKFGMMGDYFKDRGNPTDADLGRYAVTKREEDRQVFKVPSLRNIEKTAPYLHDGTAANLPQAIETMAKYQLGRYVDIEEVMAIEAFLKCLNGEVKK